MRFFGEVRAFAKFASPREDFQDGDPDPKARGPRETPDGGPDRAWCLFLFNSAFGHPCAVFFSLFKRERLRPRSSSSPSPPTSSSIGFTQVRSTAQTPSPPRFCGERAGPVAKRCRAG